MSKEFSYRANGWFCRVGETVRFFQFSNYKSEERCFDAACSWFNEQIKFQSSFLSLSKILRVVGVLETLSIVVRKGFPVSGKDFNWVIDEYNGQIYLAFGSLLVSECGAGYNIEIVTNWLTKERFDVCSGVSIETAANVICASPASRSYWHQSPTELHFSRKNLSAAKMLCGLA